MANLLMHPRADSLTFLFTTQSGCEKGGEMREEREEGRGKKKETKCCFSFNHPVVSCPHSCCGLQDATLQACWFCFRQLSRIGGTVVDTDKNKVEDKCRLADVPVWTLWAPPRYTSAQWESAS